MWAQPPSVSDPQRHLPNDAPKLRPSRNLTEQEKRRYTCPVAFATYNCVAPSLGAALIWTEVAAPARRKTLRGIPCGSS